ncbi:TetR family transcriptional regulator C-terminal domain-containing protein [Streptomyces sp. AD2-2]|nr:TetR family transcriptional regulator C-terminal domain-containing protein [Streptomyces sp. AD2-2]
MSSASGAMVPTNVSQLSTPSMSEKAARGARRAGDVLRDRAEAGDVVLCRVPRHRYNSRSPPGTSTNGRCGSGWYRAVADVLHECRCVGLTPEADVEALADPFTATVDGLAIQILAGSTDMRPDRMRSPLLRAFEPHLGLTDRLRRPLGDSPNAVRSNASDATSFQGAAPWKPGT